MANSSDGYNLGMHHLQYNQPNFFRNQKQSEPPQYHHNHQSNMSNNHHTLAAAAQQDPLGRFQGLDISNRGGSIYFYDAVWGFKKLTVDEDEHKKMLQKIIVSM